LLGLSGQGRLFQLFFAGIKKKAKATRRGKSRPFCYGERGIERARGEIKVGIARKIKEEKAERRVIRAEGSSRREMGET